MALPTPRPCHSASIVTSSSFATSVPLRRRDRVAHDAGADGGAIAVVARERQPDESELRMQHEQIEGAFQRRLAAVAVRCARRKIVIVLSEERAEERHRRRARLRRHLRTVNFARANCFARLAHTAASVRDYHSRRGESSTALNRSATRPSGLGSLRSPASLTPRPPHAITIVDEVSRRPRSIARRRALRAWARCARPPRSFERIPDE